MKQPMPTPSVRLKICSKCGQKKPVSEYYTRKDGSLLAECKTCSRKRNAKRYHSEKYIEIREKDNAAMRQKRVAVREKVFAAYGGYICVCCGETEKTFLTIDHINNDGANHRRSITGKRTSAGYHTYIWLVKNGFPTGYQVLCMNCQHGKRMNNGICPHSLRVTTIPEVGVGSSDSKCGGSISTDQDIVSSVLKDTAVH